MPEPIPAQTSAPKTHGPIVNAEDQPSKTPAPQTHGPIVSAEDQPSKTPAPKTHFDMKNKLVKALEQYLRERPKTLWYRFLGFLHLSIRIRIIDKVQTLRRDIQNHINDNDFSITDVENKIRNNGLVFGLKKRPNKLEKIIDQHCNTTLHPENVPAPSP